MLENALAKPKFKKLFYQQHGLEMGVSVHIVGPKVDLLDAAVALGLLELVGHEAGAEHLRGLLPRNLATPA